MSDYQQPQYGPPQGLVPPPPQGFQQPYPGQQPFAAQQGYGPPPTHWERPFAPLRTRPVGTTILLYIVTFGIYGLVWNYKVHNELPRRPGTDDTPGMAIGMFFVPFFNLYWMFRIYLRLSDRLNLLAAETSAPVPPVKRGLALAFCICVLIPYVGILPAIICQIIWWVQAQETMNRLAATWGTDRMAA
jgi:hypothetical protein